MKSWRGWLTRGRDALAGWARQMGEPLFGVAVAGIAGILLADWCGGVAVWAAAAGLLGSAAAWRPGKWWIYAAVLTIFGLMHTLQMRDPLRETVSRHLSVGSAAAARVTGIVADAPVPGWGGESWRFPLEVESLKVGNVDWPGRHGKLYVRLTDTMMPPVYGDRIDLSGIVSRPQRVRNPGEFDFANYLLRNGFSAEFISGGGPEQCKTLAAGQGNPVMAAALRGREWIGRAVTADIGDAPEIAATVRSMVLGSREKTPEEITDAFRTSGTMHIFSVSGLHVALFGLILVFVLSRTPLRPGWIVPLTLALLAFYVFVTGLQPSAWRATIMLGLIMLGPWRNREANLFNSLAGAAILLLGWDTRQLFQAGFVLSFGVVLSLALFQKPLEHVADGMLGRCTAPDPFLPEELWSRTQKAWFSFRRWLCGALGLSAACTFGSMPLMLGYFNMITPVGILANLFIVTLSFCILSVACASLVFSAIGVPGISILWNNANWALTWCTIGLAQFFASLPWGHIRIDPARLWRGDPCELVVLALDHGGGATRIDTPSGRQWMVDCGGMKHWTSTVRPHLERAPVNILEGVIVTHTDTYHSSALGPLEALFHPRQVWRGGHAGARDQPEDFLFMGRKLDLDDRTTVKVLFPPASWVASNGDDRSLVLLLECRGWRVLMMSDAGFLTEKALLGSGMDLRADVLVKGRHGSDFSGLPEFINAVHPGALVYTNNRFPENERVPDSWRDRMAAKGIAMFDQALTGGVTLRMDDAGISVRSFLGGQEWKAPPKPAPAWTAPAEKPGPLVR